MIDENKNNNTRDNAAKEMKLKRPLKIFLIKS